MSLFDTYKLLISGYLGISEMDEYSLKDYVLKDINDYIKKFVNTYNLDYNYYTVRSELETSSMKVKLLDSLLVLNMIGNYLDLTLMIKRKLKDLD